MAQVEALVSHIVGEELERGPGALLHGWRALSAGALAGVESGGSGGGRTPGNAILIFMTGAEEINRTVSPCDSRTSPV